MAKKPKKLINSRPSQKTPWV